jgi:hypothetical protein
MYKIHKQYISWGWEICGNYNSLMHNCAHFSPCTGTLTIFQKLAPDSGIYAQQSLKKNLPTGRRHIITLTVQTCLPPGFRLSQNIDFNPRCMEHSGTFKGFPLADATLCNVASAYGRPLHQDVHGQGQPLFCLEAIHLLLAIYFISSFPCPNINLTLSWPSWEQEVVKKSITLSVPHLRIRMRKKQKHISTIVPTL